MRGGGECGVFAQMEDRRWVHRNCGRERVSVCGVSSKCADGNERLCAVAVGTFYFIFCSMEAAHPIRPDSWFPIDT